MSKTLEFYFDFASPTTYLAHKRLQQLREQYDLIIEYKPMLLGGVFKATGNTTPVAIPAKGKYMLESDLGRRGALRRREANPSARAVRAHAQVRARAGGRLQVAVDLESQLRSHVVVPRRQVQVGARARDRGQCHQANDEAGNKAGQ